MASSKRRGLLTEMIVMTPGLAAISSSVMPRAIAIMRMPSSARPGADRGAVEGEVRVQ